MLYRETYSKSCEASQMKPFANIVQLNYICKNSIFHVWQDCQYASLVCLLLSLKNELPRMTTTDY